MISLTIDGKKATVKKGTTILEAAKSIGIKIPTLCYDPRIVPHGTCRMCVVELEGSNKLATSCSTPAADGMVVFTETKKTTEARRTVLDLLLSNHPLDCLTCEKAGDCELQDLCYKYDVKESSFQGEKLTAEIDRTNQFYERDPNKCILCGKCVYVCAQLQCTNAIGFSQRGFRTHIAIPFEQDLDASLCVSCGNCVSACPTGALIPKRKEKFRYWETDTTRTTCSYCGVGCQMDLLTKDNKVVEIKPAMGTPNEGLLCVKGKFAYNFVNHDSRLKSPLLKKDGKFEEISWDEAYDIIVEKINDVKKNYGPDAIAGLSSARCTNEENYLMQKLMRAVIGTNNIDHCARL